MVYLKREREREREREHSCLNIMSGTVYSITPALSIQMERSNIIL
jgi:hypothetical protein